MEDELEATQAQETAPAEDQSYSDQAETQSEGGFDQNAQGAIPAPGQLDNAQQEQQSTFLQGSTLDPTKLPPEIQPIYKRMQGAYTKRMQQAADWQRQAEIVDRFNSDRDFAFQTVAQWAARNGFQIAPVGASFNQQAQQPQQAAFGKSGQPSPQIVEAIKANLPPELQWMAEAQAPAIQTAVQQMLQPLVQQLVQSQSTAQQQVAEQEWDRHAEALSSVAPGWEEHESEMTELYEFWQSPAMYSPKFGSKHQLLYNMITGNAAATAQVTKRMNAAAKNRPSSSLVTGRTAPNLTERIKGARSSQDAFRLAAQAADSATGGA